MTRRTLDEHGNYAAPWVDHGVEYNPVSPRSKRPVVQSQAERDFAESIDGVPTREHQGGGLWDHEEEARTRARGSSTPVPVQLSKNWPHKPVGRYDDERMQRFVEANAGELTLLELNTYAWFWRERLSYGQIARKDGCSKDTVRDRVKYLRRKSNGR